MLANIYRQDCNYEKAFQMLRRDAELRTESHHPWMSMAKIQFEIATGLAQSLIVYKPKNLEEPLSLWKKQRK